MALLNVSIDEDESIECELTIGQYTPISERTFVNVWAKIEPAGNISEDNRLKIKSSDYEIVLPEFPIDRPWLPQQAINILNRIIKKETIPEEQLLTLMDLVSEQATTHFQLKYGKFIASTFLGQIVEVSDTRIELLKKIQNHTFNEEIFVWRVGFSSFSDRV